MSQHRWDLEWLAHSYNISLNSKDPSTQTGAVIVRPDNSVASVGYNGFPKKMPDSPALYSDRNEKYSRIIHCEVNALLFARERVDGYTLYTFPFISCDRCFVTMVQAGIVRFVAPTATEEQLTRWGTAFDRVRGYAQECGVDLIEINRDEVLEYIKNRHLVDSQL